jgi:hypothetical protein
MVDEWVERMGEHLVVHLAWKKGN